MDDYTIKVCFLGFHEMAIPPMAKTNHSLDLHSSDFEYQLASEKPSITAGYPV